MIGVVLWSDPVEGKAVFWCEDQGDLAYYEAPSSFGPDNGIFDAGDMVQFTVSLQSRQRLAHDPKLVLEKACADLPDTLRNSAAGQPSGRSAEIVLFKPKEVSEVCAPASKPALSRASLRP